MIEAEEAFEIICLTLKDEGGRFMLAKMDEGGNVSEPWTAGLEWGREAEDSDMVGAAAYAVGSTPQRAVQAMLVDAGKYEVKEED